MTEAASNPIKDMVLELVSSKKFVASISAGVAVIALRIAGKAGWALDADTAREVANSITALAAAYCVGQGLNDHGKAAAEIHADAAAESGK